MLEEIRKLYPKTKMLYGPYIRKADGRAIVVLYDGVNKTAKLLAKIKLELKLGRCLSKDETVDHIDGNPVNDNSGNLQLLSISENARKSALGNCYALGYKQRDEDKRRGIEFSFSQMQ